ncbi:EAL domain-containing protein [Segnochrobactraceae bacterium EtOH-i3]
MRLLRVCLVVLGVLTLLGTARAADPIAIPLDAPAIDLTDVIEVMPDVDERIQASTAPSADGIVRRIEVRSTSGDARGWAVFSLTNPGDTQIDRLLVAPHFRLVGSGIFRPDLGAQRIVTVTPSQGFAPERLPNRDADVFLITLDPGATVTFVAELASDTMPQLYLWEPNAYKDSVNAYALYKGIVLGIAGLLALFLSIVFVVKGTVLFPATAALAWAVLGYLTIDFEFWTEVFRIESGPDTRWRAIAEIAVPATLALFLYAYLNLNRWHVRFATLMIVIVLATAGLVGLAIADPVLAAGIARVSFGVVGVGGFLLITVFCFKGYDRAIMLVPTWTLLLVWMAGSWAAATGHLDNDIAQPALGGGLVLIVLLIGFTVVQHAFAGGSITDGLVSDVERRALALTGAGDFIWDWDVPRDRVTTDREIEERLGLETGTLQGAALGWLDIIHPLDRDRFRLSLDAIIDRRRGRISDVFRLRAADGHYRWFLLRARPVVGSDGEAVRCVGTLQDVTDAKVAEERLLQDSVHDTFTGLPNRALLVDRLETALVRARLNRIPGPTLLYVDLDLFAGVNEIHGPAIGDSALLTIARRLGRMLKPEDTLARVGGDSFAILLLSDPEEAVLAVFIEDLRRQVRAAIAFGSQQIQLTASIGMVRGISGPAAARQALSDAELAMTEARRAGGDRVVTFTPELRRLATAPQSLADEVRHAFEADEIRLVFDPVVRVENGTIAGFRISPRWVSPRRGTLDGAATLALIDSVGQIADLTAFLVDRAARRLSMWQQEWAGDEPLFFCVQVPGVIGQGITRELVADVKAALTRSPVARGSLRIGFGEATVMQNQGLAAVVMRRLRELGAGVGIRDFGRGSASIACLEKLPLDQVTFDTKSLADPRRAGVRPMLLSALAEIAHGLGVVAVAAGAETENDELDFAQAGFPFTTGPLYGTGLSAEEAARLISTLQMADEDA